MDQVALLVERCRLQSEGVDDIVDLDGLVVGTFIVATLGGSIGTGVLMRKSVGRSVVKKVGYAVVRTDVDGVESDHGTVDLVHDTVDQLGFIRVRDDLVSGDDVLESSPKLAHLVLHMRRILDDPTRVLSSLPGHDISVR